MDTLIWNATRFERQNSNQPIEIIWPAVTVMEDGSKFGASATLCGFRTDHGEQASKAAAVIPAPALNPGSPSRQLQNLINSGKASLVNITSDPPGANVDVDGKMMGKTPMSFVLMGTIDGEPRNILVYKEGYTLAGRDVIPNGATFTLNEKLTALPGR